MSIRMVADTQALIWYVTQNTQLSSPARSFLRKVDRADGEVAVSSMTLVEILYLVEKNRINQDTLEVVVSLLNDTDSSLVEIPIDHKIVQAMKQIPREQIPEMPDRIISATALYLEVPLITSDLKIRDSFVPTIW